MSTGHRRNTGESKATQQNNAALYLLDVFPR